MTTDATAGDRLLDGRYRLDARIGAGAVAEVYRAIDERLARAVAVKVFRGDAAEQLQRHDAEMRLLAALDHPSLVTVFDAGTDEQSGQPYLVMQLVEGTTLADELKRGPLPAERAAQYGAALADALGYVHERGLVHRDVKPANVLVSDDGRVHLADFGIARLVDDAHQTRTGDVLGTPAYFAPEQVAGEGVGPPADIYALAMVLLEALTGRRPFEGTAMEVAMARLTRQPEIPARLGPDWAALLSAMTQRDPQRRPSASQVAESLRAIASGTRLDPTVAYTPTGVAPTVAAPTAAVGTETSVLPPLAATQLATTYGPAAPHPAATPPATRPSRRGPAAAVVVLALLIVAGLVAAIVYALHSPSGSGGSGTTVKHPGPHLRQPLERDVRRLENLVHS